MARKVIFPRGHADRRCATASKEPILRTRTVARHDAPHDRQPRGRTAISTLRGNRHPRATSADPCDAYLPVRRRHPRPADFRARGWDAIRFSRPCRDRTATAYAAAAILTIHSCSTVSDRPHASAARLESPVVAHGNLGLDQPASQVLRRRNACGLLAGRGRASGPHSGLLEPRAFRLRPITRLFGDYSLHPGEVCTGRRPSTGFEAVNCRS